MNDMGLPPHLNLSWIVQYPMTAVIAGCDVVVCKFTTIRSIVLVRLPTSGWLQKH